MKLSHLKSMLYFSFYVFIRYGSVVEYYCDEGYKLIGPIQRLCVGNGQWEGDEPKCVLARCPLPQSLANGDIVASDTTYRSIARYTCHRGYELKGSAERVCLSDETWSGSDPTCVAITCSTDKLHLEYGRIIGKEFLI